jgi:hypothetical protein
MIELYGFFKALERDYNQVMRGIPIRYGTHHKKIPDVSKSVGWVRPTKRQRAAINDGRAPDTTDLLFGKSTKPAKKPKLGRPAHSPNIDKNLFTTYISYVAVKDLKKKTNVGSRLPWNHSTLPTVPSGWKSQEGKLRISFTTLCLISTHKVLTNWPNQPPYERFS